jgi:hypothetical protein
MFSELRRKGENVRMILVICSVLLPARQEHYMFVTTMTVALAVNILGWEMCDLATPGQK